MLAFDVVLCVDVGLLPPPPLFFSSNIRKMVAEDMLYAERAAQVKA